MSSNERDFWNSGVFAPKNINVRSEVEVKLPSGVSQPAPIPSNSGDIPKKLLAVSPLKQQVFLVVGTAVLVVGCLGLVKAKDRWLAFVGGGVLGSAATFLTKPSVTSSKANSQRLSELVDKIGSDYVQLPGATLEGQAAIEYVKKKLQGD